MNLWPMHDSDVPLWKTWSVSQRVVFIFLSKAKPDQAVGSCKIQEEVGSDQANAQWTRPDV